MPARELPHVAIIGTGFSGLCLAIQLVKTGVARFTLFEKAEKIGGTWRDNVYPGASCDLPSFAYCFSFEQKTDWTQKWADQDEILAYMEHCAEKYDLLPHVRFGTEIASARFDSEAGRWRLRSTEGEEFEADVLVSGVGQLARPAVPDLPGLEDFAGETFHSARWSPEFDARGKTVGVVGNAASAVQFVPRLAADVERLLVFQRSANWMLRRGNRPYRAAELRRFTRFRWLARLYRGSLWARFEAGFPLFRRNRSYLAISRRLALRHLAEEVDDPALREALVPDYPIGAKRILISDDYYATLMRPNVELVRSGIERIRPDGVETRDGRRIPLDALILATGFRSNEFLAPMAIEGLDGKRLEKEWEHGAEAYLGLTVSGFPNFFMMYGPNTNLGHNSIIFMIECQTQYVLGCLALLRERGARSLDVRESVMRRFNAKLSRELDATIWATTGKTWYKNDAGKITNNWSGTTARYWWCTRRVRPSDFELRV